jgi:hypothetical protein
MMGIGEVEVAGRWAARLRPQVAQNTASGTLRRPHSVQMTALSVVIGAIYRPGRDRTAW